MTDEDRPERTIDTGGGAYVEGEIHTEGGDVVGRDKVTDIGHVDGPVAIDGGEAVDLRGARNVQYKPTIIQQPPREPPPPPFMAEAPPKDFVERPREYDQLVAHLLDEERRPVAISAALRGAGGYGKTTMARAICHDGRVREAFKDGILWVTLGQTPNVLGQILKLYGALSGERPAFVDVEDGAKKLADALDGRQCLMVVDDVWNEAHLRPFLRGGDNCARLITTRNADILPADASTVNVDAMQQDEALALLSAGLPGGEGQAPALRELAARLGEWPLLLQLANGALRLRIDQYRQSLPDALAYVVRVLDRRGLTAFDARDAQARDQAVATTLGVSLDLLTEEERPRYYELATFPEDVDIPIAVLERLWGATCGFDDLDTEDLVVRLDRLSLLQECDLAKGCVRLHDVMRAYLVTEWGDRLATLHARFLDAYELERWADLPRRESYLWGYLAYHLAQAGRESDLRVLLLDVDWMQAKLEATDVNALLSDYEVIVPNASLDLLHGALRLSAHVLARDRAQLHSQLCGRLLGQQEPEIQGLVKRLSEWGGASWLRPLTATLTPPGGLLAGILQDTGGVRSVAVTSDGRFAVSTAGDRTLVVWDLRTGQRLRTLEGHAKSVNAVALTPDDQHAVSASKDRTLIVWDLHTGEDLRTLEGHKKSVEAVVVTPDGQHVVSASKDRTLIVWDLHTGGRTRVLEGHTDQVSAVAVTLDGRHVVSSSWRERSLIVWDLHTGGRLNTIQTDPSLIHAVAVTPDSEHLVCACNEHTVTVWDLHTGQRLRIFEGHSRSVFAVAVTPDGQHAVSASRDRTLIVWDLHTGRCLRSLVGHTDWVTSVAVTADGQHAVSGSNDGTLIVWDLQSGQRVPAPEGHTDFVWSVAATPDGQRVVSVSNDGTLIVWDARSGQRLRTLQGHSGSVSAVALTTDGQYAVSAGDDARLIVWDLQSGDPLRTVRCRTDWVTSVAVTPDNQHAVSGCYFERYLQQWHLQTGRRVRTYRGYKRGVQSVAVTPDGQYVVAAYEKHSLLVWDLHTGERLHPLRGHTDIVTSVAVTPDSQHAISASWDRTLIVWNLHTGEHLRMLRGHTDWVWAVAVAPHGRYAVSASKDRTLIVWDLQTGDIITRFSGEGSLHACTAAGDGTIVTAGASGRVHFLWLQNDHL
jgi:WD40 repeat protein